MTGFVSVAKVDDIPVGSFKTFEINDESIMVVHTEDGFYALINQCTHDGAAISDGKLIHNEVICTRHGARFDVKTGNVTRAPALVPLETFEVKVEDGQIMVRVEE